MKTFAPIAIVIGYIALTVATIVSTVRHPTSVIEWAVAVAVVGTGVGAIWSARQTVTRAAADKQLNAAVTGAQRVVDKLDAHIPAAPQNSRIEPSSDIRQMGVAVGQMVASLQQDGGLTRAEAVQFAASLCRSGGTSSD